jgi:pimeloyl-ACP methyl ester carboxylesterase
MNEQVVVNGSLISYSVFNEEKRARGCLLFLHGWRSSKEIWDKVAESLKSSSHQVVAIDLPGFGKSPAPKTPWRVGDYAETVAEFIRKLNLQKVIIVGHSFGGRVGIKLVSQYPNIVSKLVLVDSAGFAMDSGKKLAMNLAAKITKPIFKPAMMQELRKKIYKAIGSEDYVETPNLTQTYLNTISEDLTKDVKKIGLPTLIIYGQDDTATPPQFGEKMHSLIPNSQLLILNNAGHFSFLDKQEEFVESLSDFIK